LNSYFVPTEIDCTRGRAILVGIWRSCVDLPWRLGTVRSRAIITCKAFFFSATVFLT